MNEQEAINDLTDFSIGASQEVSNLSLAMAIKALEEIQQYRAIGTVDELKQLKDNGAFTGMELAQIAIMQINLKEYLKIGTAEECRVAVEKQKEMKAYCDENTCAGCPYHNTSSKDNKCMNDFIAD